MQREAEQGPAPAPSGPALQPAAGAPEGVRGSADGRSCSVTSTPGTMLLRTPGTRSTSRGRTGLSDSRRCPASASASVSGGRTATQLARARGRHSLTVAVPGPRRSPVSRNPSPLQGVWVAPATPEGAWREQVPSLQGHSAETSSRDGLKGPVGKRGKGQGGRGVLRAVSVWAGQDQWQRLTSPSTPSEPETKPLHVRGRDPARETGLLFTGGKLSPRDTKHLPGSGSKGQGRDLNQASWPLSRPQGDHGMCHPAPGQGPHPSASGRACPQGLPGRGHSRGSPAL